MDKQAHIIKGPHVLFTGANGTKTFGITVRSMKVETARCQEWSVNQHDLTNRTEVYREYLGLDVTEMACLLAEFGTL